MFKTAKELVEYCKKNDCKISDYVLEEEAKTSKKSKEEIKTELKKMLDIMETTSMKTVEGGSNLPHGLINDFAKKTWDYANEDRVHVTESNIIKSMAMAFSTFECNSGMEKIVASPTAGSSGILPAAIFSAKNKLNCDDDALIAGLLTAIGIGQFIGGYGTFAGSEGGCQAECGAAASMAAGALVEIYGGTPAQSLEAASVAIVNILGLVCDPIGGLVQFPCTFRNSSGVINAMLSADLALAGTTSVIPFDEVCQAMSEVGKAMPASLRETGLGGLAGTKSGQKICKNIFG